MVTAMACADTDAPLINDDFFGVSAQRRSGYPFMLEPYHSPNPAHTCTRHTCPQCGKPGRFVRYIICATGEYIADEVGRCNREDSCGYHLTPSQYYAQHPEADRPKYKALPPVRGFRPILPPQRPVELYTISADTIQSRWQCEADYESRRLETQKKWNFPGLFKRCGDYDLYRQRHIEMIKTAAFDAGPYHSKFHYWLMQTIGLKAYHKVAAMYRLGCWRSNRSVIYWQIDIEQRIRSGKLMYYDDNGHRIKDSNPDWVHTSKVLPSSWGYLPENWRLEQCLYGEHLLNKNDTSAPVALVESEKTALICAGLTNGSTVWLATGGKVNIKPEKFLPLKGRRVIVYPDLGATDEWKAKLLPISKQIGFSMKISMLLEQRATDDDRQKGLDIADFLIQSTHTD